MLTQEEFIRIVRDQLRLPLTDSDLENNFDQKVIWRSIHLVRLFVAMEKQTGRRIPVARLFAESTVRGIFTLFATPEDEERGAA